MPAVAPPDPNTATRGMPLPGAALPIVPTPVQVASPPVAAPLSPLRNLPGADFGAQVVGPTSVGLAQNAQRAFAQGNNLQGVAGEVGAVGSGVLHAATVPFAAAGQVIGDTLSDLGHRGAQAVGQVYKGLTGGAAAPDGPSAGLAGIGPAYDPSKNMVSPFGITYNRATGPTLEQAQAISKASDASVAAPTALSAVDQARFNSINPTAFPNAPAVPVAVPAGSPAGLGGSVPVAGPGGGGRLEAYIMTHPSVAAAAGAASQLATARGTGQTNDVNKTINDVFMNEYMKGAGQKQNETAEQYLERRYTDQQTLAKNYAVYAKPAYAVAQQVAN